jgi:hypothetical protein
MNSKWYLGILVVTLAFFGKSLEQKNAPNQEIVVQFSGDIISPLETQDALESVQKQLKSIGAEQIQVAKAADGTIKVTYFSSIDVAIVKALFSTEENFELGYTAFNNKGEKEGADSFPFESGISAYQLNVSEIPNKSQRDLGFDGILVEIKFLRDQYVNPIGYFGASEKEFTLKTHIEKLNNNLYDTSAIIINNTSYKIPEVRAGPLV